MSSEHVTAHPGREVPGAPPWSDAAPPVPSGGNGVVTWLAFLVAIGVAAGSVWMTLGMKLIACPLCLYQRAFAFGVLGVLTAGLFLGVPRRGLLSLLALPLALAAVAVSLFHVFLEAEGTLECPSGPLGFGSAPQEAAAGLGLLLLVLAVDVMIMAPKNVLLPLAGVAVLGVVLGVGALGTAPALVLPKEPYPKPVEEFGCRPPFRK